jgi:hypothetical protein
MLPASQVAAADYFAFGELVEISGTVNGDLYALGGAVFIDGRINGDVIAARCKVSALHIHVHTSGNEEPARGKPDDDQILQVSVGHLVQVEPQRRPPRLVRGNRASQEERQHGGRYGAAVL